MKKTAVLLITITLISKIFGFGRELTLAYFYGSSSVSDAYLISLTIPGTIFVFIATSLATTYIPMYTEIKNKKTKKEADYFTNQLIVLVIIIATLLITLVYFKTEFFVRIFASGFSNDTLELAVNFTKISVLGIFFTGISIILTNYLQINNFFVATAIISIPYNLSIILFIILSSSVSLSLLPMGIVISMLIELIIVCGLAYRKSFIISIKVKFDENIRKIFYLSLPVIMGTSINQINTLVDRTMASQITAGGISALNYGNRVIFLIQGVLITTISMLIYPKISKMVVNGEFRKLKEQIYKVSFLLSYMLIPITVFLLFFSKEITSFLFERGAFDKEALILTSTVIFFYSIGILAMGYREVLSKVFYSLKDTKTPAINASIGLILNIAMNLTLAKYIGIGGLALSTSLSAIITSLLLIGNLRKKIGGLNLKKLLLVNLKISSASFFSIILSRIAFDLMILHISETLSIFITICISLVIYLLFSFALKIKELNIFLIEIKKYIKKIKK